VHNLKFPESLLSYVLTFNKALPESLINLINHQIFIKTKNNFEKGTVGNTESSVIRDDSVRSVEVLGLDEHDIGVSVSNRSIYNKLMTINNTILSLYSSRVTRFIIPPNRVVFQFLNYTDKIKGHYDFHTDSSFINPRMTTTIISLSDKDEYEGGELIVGNSEKLKFDKGSGVIFPSNFLYPHKVYPVTKGIRKVLVIWNT